MSTKIEVTEQLNIQPQASIYGTFGRYNYKLWYAIAEFVDNSTASFYKNEKTMEAINHDHIEVKIDYDANREILTITDDAFGMEIADFRRAILLGAKPEIPNGRNEFGMGLKTAASWFGKVWTVTSTQYGSNKRYTATVDIPKLEKEQSNIVDILSQDADTSEHGTTLTIRDLNRKLTGGRTIENIKNVLRSMYRRDLESGKIKITYRGESLYFKPYQVLEYKGKKWQMPVDFYFDFGGIVHHVTGMVGLLGGDDSGFKKAGFALFRRDRVVVGAEGSYYKPTEIFGESQSPVAHKLFGELDLDDFQINQAKDGFVWDDGLEDAFLSALKEQIVEYIRLASKTIRARENEYDPNDESQKKKTVETTQASLNKLFVKEGQQIDSPAPQRPMSDDERLFEEGFVNSPDGPETVYQQSEQVYQVPVNDVVQTIKVTWADAGSAYWYSVDKNLNEIKINICHPFFKPFSSSENFRNVLNKFVIALYLAEKESEESSKYSGFAYTDDINNNINDILKQLAKGN